MKVLYRGKSLVDAGLIYGCFSTETLAMQYAAGICERDKINARELHTVDLLVDPVFHVVQPEIIDNMGPQG